MKIYYLKSVVMNEYNTNNNKNIQIESESNDCDKYAEIPKSYDELIKMKSKEIAVIERIKSGYGNMPRYYNFFAFCLYGRNYPCPEHAHNVASTSIKTST